MLCGLALSIILSATPGVDLSPDSKEITAAMNPVPFTRVQLRDRFWKPKIEINRTRTLPHNFRMCKETGRIANFARAAGRDSTPFEGIYFNDSDVYKVIEGAAYALATSPEDADLRKSMEDVIELITAAQQPDGYVNTYFTLVKPDERWTNLWDLHELYCSGHLIEAAIAHHAATGADHFLNVAVRLADYIDSIFGPDKRFGYPGHEEIELALLKLHNVTGEPRYLELTKFFLEARGRERNPEKEFCQAYAPIVEHNTIMGHAVRAMYLYSAVTDWTRVSGNAQFVPALDRVWENLINRRMYITGGIGSIRETEGFSSDYDLPNDHAYCETCASIGMAFWNHRMLLLRGNSQYADVLERALYNGILSGVSQDGENFFYENPLASRGDHHRKPWYSCACCPPNIARFMPTIGGYLFGESNNSVWVNLYAACNAEIRVESGTVRLEETTDYPWSGRIRIKVSETPGGKWSLHLRIPSWCKDSSVRVNGRLVASASGANGYLTIERVWRNGDTIDLDFPMAIRQTVADAQVEANKGRTALERGPLVYCVEGADQGYFVRHLSLPPGATIRSRRVPDLFGGIETLEADGFAVEANPEKGGLYRESPRIRPTRVTAIPYFLWDNRSAGEMAVWIPSTPLLAEPAPGSSH